MNNKTSAALQTPATPLRAFRHSRKGLLVGRVLREQPDPNGGAWMDIKLTRPTIWLRGARRTRITIAPGETLTFRKALAVEVQP